MGFTPFPLLPSEQFYSVLTTSGMNRTLVKKLKEPRETPILQRAQEGQGNGREGDRT